MKFALFLPPQSEKNDVPLIYWLSGLTCTDENFVQKAGAQRYAAEYGIAILAPDTSPRGENVPDDPDESYDFGLGAGFYVNATQEPWKKNYQMYEYVTEELPQLINTSDLPIDSSRCSISGHSMGGHGALICALRNPDRYRSVSAFSPIVAPSQCPWGNKALSNYLGEEEFVWQTYDANELIKNGASQLPTLIDQGTTDNFLEEQLKTSILEKTCDEVGYDAYIRYQEGYDHSYFFIASFIGEHIAFHNQFLKAD
tara:strand:- start:14 stop:778 length:765 start_codon:yes stop_codon:yes gene_type:complete